MTFPVRVNELIDSVLERFSKIDIKLFFLKTPYKKSIIAYILGVIFK